jgi:hypothetical protein
MGSAAGIDGGDVGVDGGVCTVYGGGLIGGGVVSCTRVEEVEIDATLTCNPPGSVILVGGFFGIQRFGTLGSFLLLHH